jgi:hypothetical protein
MATSFAFGNKIIKIPGAYSKIESGIQNPPSGLDFGALLVIDTGSGANWGGGSGILGTFQQGKNSLSTVQDIQQMRDLTKGGIWFDLAVPLFRPAQLGILGVSSVTFVKAAETTPAEIEYEFTGGGANGGIISFKAKSEGTFGNGVLTSGELTKGYAATMTAGVEDPSKFRISFYEGTFRGLDPTGEPIGLAAAATKPRLIAVSAEFDNIAELAGWASTNQQIFEYFEVEFAVVGTGVVDGDDLIANSGYNIATGGSEDYSPEALTAALEAIKDLNVDFVLADKFGPDALDANNLQILATIAEEMPVKPDMYVAAASDEAGWNTTISVAEAYDSQYVTVVHGGIKATKKTGQGFKNLPAIYKAAYILGRESGLEPQIPLTFKGIGIQGEVHILSDKQVERGLDKGILMTRFVNGTFDIVKGINSLQNNQFLVNEDGTTSSKQIRRIVRQIDKELTILSKQQLLKNPTGVNRNTLSPDDLKNWLESYLLSITATQNQDNLIIGFQDVVITRQSDAYFANYAIIPNSEISFLFFRGLLINI